MSRRRSVWHEYQIECCVNCVKELEAAWGSSHKAFGEGKRLVELEPGVIMTNLSKRDMALLKRHSFMRHRLPEPLTGYDPSGPAPWDEEEDHS
jgi:hypothetical protein